MIESPARCLINEPLSNIRQLVYFLSYHAVVDNDKYDSGSHLRPALLSQIETEFATEKFHHPLKLLQLKTKLFDPPTGAQECEDISSLVIEIKGCLRSPRLSGIFWLLMDSSTVSNIADRTRVTSIKNSCRNLSPDDSGFSTLETCGSNLLSERNSIEPEAMPDCRSADLPVRLAMALELMNRKRFVEAYGHLSISASLSAPEIGPEIDALFYLPAMTEFVKCCNILNKEHEGVKSAQRALAYITEADHQVQVCSLRIALADALIGQKEYAGAKTILEGILDGKCPSDHLKTITSLRLSKIDRRLGFWPTPCLSPGGHLGHIFLSPRDVPVDLMNECIDELTSACSFVRQRNNNGASTSVIYLAHIKSAIPVNINISDRWRVLALHEQISSISPSSNPNFHERSVVQIPTSAPLIPVHSDYPSHSHSTVGATDSHPNKDISASVESPRPSPHPESALRVSQIEDPQQEQQLIDGQTILPQTLHILSNYNGPKLPCYLLPQHDGMSTIFFGRQRELSMIDQTFFRGLSTPTPSSLRSVAISGLGGMGKTQIAIQYISLYMHRFEAIFWLRADNANVLAHNFARISWELGLLKLEEAHEAHLDLTLCRRRVKRWLSNPVRSFDRISGQLTEVSWLLIFDNVNDISIIQPYWPIRGHGSVLITTRSPFSDMSHYSIGLGIALMPLGFLETTDYIRSFTVASGEICQDDDLQEDLAASARILDGLPLALFRMEYMSQCSDVSVRVSVRDFVTAHDQWWQPLDDKKMETLDQEYTRFLATVWQLDSLSPNANALLQLIAFFSAESIPENMLTTDHLWGYDEARAILIQSSLINYNKFRAEITVHPVVQEVMRRRMDTSSYSRVLGAAFAMLSEVWPFQHLMGRHSTSHWQTIAELLPNFLSLTGHLKKTMSIDVSTRSLRSIILIATMLNEAGWYEQC